MRFELLTRPGSPTYGVWDHDWSKPVGDGKGGQFATLDILEARKAVHVMNERVAGL